MSTEDRLTLVDMGEMFYEVQLSIENYDSLLQGWAQLLLRSFVSFQGGNSQYS